jgi:hypothetical protein
MPTQPYSLHIRLASLSRIDGELEKAIPADSKLKFRTNTQHAHRRQKRRHVPGTNWTKKDEFTFTFWD